MKERLLDLPAYEQSLLGSDQVGAEPRSRLDGAIEAHRHALPLGVDSRQRLVAEDAFCLAIRLVRHRHPVDGCGRLNAGRGIDDVPGDDSLTELRPGVQRDDRRAGVDADPNLKLELRVSLVELGDRLDDSQSRPDGSLRVVLVRDRRAEDRHHSVADELLQLTAVAIDRLAHGLEIRVLDKGDILGIEPLRQRRETDEIAEENRHDLPLLARRCRLGDEQTAAVAEPRGIRVLGTAARADHRPSLEHVRAPFSVASRPCCTTQLSSSG